MPDNTWFTPYKLPSSKCLSLGPSQGIVYELNKRAVVKLPFQYPVGNGSTIDAKKDHLYLSLRSFALLKRERQFYDLLAGNPHPNIAQRFPSDCVDGITTSSIARQRLPSSSTSPPKNLCSSCSSCNVSTTACASTACRNSSAANIDRSLDALEDGVWPWRVGGD